MTAMWLVRDQHKSCQVWKRRFVARSTQLQTPVSVDRRQPKKTPNYKVLEPSKTLPGGLAVSGCTEWGCSCQAPGHASSHHCLTNTPKEVPRGAASMWRARPHCLLHAGGLSLH